MLGEDVGGESFGDEQMMIHSLLLLLLLNETKSAWKKKHCYTGADADAVVAAAAAVGTMTAGD